ncbi:MAG TPA: MmcQ/YjbR family DNA-binding protein [Gaiellaceae bacterium]|nr:MmcQ/YjbR family DNA-binding protein [Gaiellaceae bacterium]
MRDLDALALALPEVTKELADDGRPSYSVNGKAFCFHRRWRKDAPFEDVLVFRTDGSEPKELLLADPRGIFFTTPHWNGYPAVLLHIPDLKQLRKQELRELLEDAWLTRAPAKLAKARFTDG